MDYYSNLIDNHCLLKGGNFIKKKKRIVTIEDFIILIKKNCVVSWSTLNYDCLFHWN